MTDKTIHDSYMKEIADTFDAGAESVTRTLCFVHFQPSSLCAVDHTPAYDDQVVPHIESDPYDSPNPYNIGYVY